MNNTGKTVKILVCYHKPDTLLKDEVFTPIHVGRALALKRKPKDDPGLQWLLDNTIGDNTGENISEKNDSYNELTALYWAWKNYDKLGNPDYIGLTHYRRHFIFRPSTQVVEECDGIDEHYYDRINYTKEAMDHLFDDCDYIAHLGKVDNVYKHYLENHHIEDLDLAIKILKQKYPKYAKTADAYMNMSYGNFCNMFIMPKELFFGYCRWIFDILESFEKKVDLSEKRLFISERLTGIYIEQLKRDGYRQKSLSATFINAPTKIPVAVPYKSESNFRTAVLMKSILKHTKKDSLVDFYVLYNDKDNINSSIFYDLIKDTQKNSITFVNVTEALKNKGYDVSKYRFPEHYPLVLSEVLDKVNKALYFDEKALFFNDIGEFYRTCNNDEFWVLGIGEGKINLKRKIIDGNAFSLNCGRIRKHRFLDLVGDNCEGKTSCEIFSEFCGKDLGYFPWWLCNVSDKANDGQLLYTKVRADQRWGVWEKPLLYFKKGMEPWENIQGLFSTYWWEVAMTIPAFIPFDCVSKNTEELMTSQSIEINKVLEQRKNQPIRRQEIHNVNDKKTGLFKRVVRYYKLHGFKHTVKKCFEKLRRENSNG